MFKFEPINSLWELAKCAYGSHVSREKVWKTDQNVLVAFIEKSLKTKTFVHYKVVSCDDKGVKLERNFPDAKIRGFGEYPGTPILNMLFLPPKDYRAIQLLTEIGQFDWFETIPEETDTFKT